MIQYNKKIIARPGYYIAQGWQKGLSLPYEADKEYEEIVIPDEVKRLVNDIYSVGDIFTLQVNESMNTKAWLVNMLFSTDDQIAIILNKEEHSEIFDIMQGWRTYFSEVINRAKAL